MNLEEYKIIIKNTVYFDFPNYLKQKLINDIKLNNVGKYGTKEKEGVVLLTGMADHNERIDACIDKNNLTLKLLDLLEVKKGYRYSIILKYKEINFENLREAIDKVGINLQSEYYNEYSEYINSDQIHYFEDENCFFIKFHKYISEIDKKNISKKYLRYPIVFVFHKNLNLFEVRFDRLSYDGDYSFHFITMKARLSQLQSIYNFQYEYFEVENSIREIVSEYKDFVAEIIWSFETAKSKGLTLRVGEDGVMPFLGDIERLVNELRSKYGNEKNANECLNEIENYMNLTKRFANEKFRILSWLKYIDNGNTIELEKTIDLKIIFNYNKNNYTLLNIYDNEINDMERINHVIRFIGRVARQIEDL